MAAKGYDFFSGTQEDINRRLLRKILELEAKVSPEDTDIDALKEDVSTLKTTVGDNNSGLVHDVIAIGTQVTTVDDIVGRTDTDPLTVLGQLKTISMDIGNDNIPSTIKGRIKALEDAE